MPVMGHVAVADSKLVPLRLMRKGTTLVELMLALVIVSIVLAALIGTLSTTSKRLRTTQYRAIALNLAKEAVEGLRTSSKSASLSALSSTTTRNNMGVPTTFSITKSVSANAGGVSGLYKLAATVTWNDAQNYARDLTLELWVSDDQM